MKSLKADVAIVSAGTAGLAAAIAAAESGASVIALEKSNHTGGTAIMGNGLFAVESRLQRIKQYPLTREEAFKIYMEFVRLDADARLVKTVIDRSAETLDWLEDMGVEFWDLGGHGIGMNFTWHLVKGDAKPLESLETAYRGNLAPGIGNAHVMTEKMTERAKQLGVEILLKTPVKKILREGDWITGLLAEGRDGEEVKVAAGAVIIATGAYGGFWPAHAGLEGDGIRMAREVGAYAVDRPPRPAGSPRPKLPRMVVSAVNPCFSQPNLIVNLLGDRFIDEETYVTSIFAGNAVARQKDRCAFSIFDENTKEFFISHGFDFTGGYGIGQMGTPPHNAAGFDEEVKLIQKYAPERLIIAGSVEELAARTGIDPAKLGATIDEYNHTCETGRDDAYGKRPRYLRAVKRPPFYARRLGAMPGGKSEGIRINYRTEVLTDDFEAIPGLYAAGIDTTCNIWQDIYPNILPGMAMGYAVNSGRIAGEHAAAFTKGG